MIIIVAAICEASMAKISGRMAHRYQDLNSDREHPYHPKYFAKKFGLTVDEAKAILQRACSRKEANRLGNTTSAIPRAASR
jgi:hypothetical protein